MPSRIGLVCAAAVLTHPASIASMKAASSLQVILFMSVVSG
jgi:hypothetical protein